MSYPASHPSYLTPQLLRYCMKQTTATDKINNKTKQIEEECTNISLYNCQDCRVWSRESWAHPPSWLSWQRTSLPRGGGGGGGGKLPFCDPHHNKSRCAENDRVLRPMLVHHSKRNTWWLTTSLPLEQDYCLRRGHEQSSVYYWSISIKGLVKTPKLRLVQRRHLLPKAGIICPPPVTQLPSR